MQRYYRIWSAKYQYTSSNYLFSWSILNKFRLPLRRTHWSSDTSWQSYHHQYSKHWKFTVFFVTFGTFCGFYSLIFKSPRCFQHLPQNQWSFGFYWRAALWSSLRLFLIGSGCCQLLWVFCFTSFAFISHFPLRTCWGPPRELFYLVFLLLMSQSYRKCTNLGM